MEWVVFGLIALASRQIGTFFTRIHFPLVTGFLLTGILAGPHVYLGLRHPAITTLDVAPVVVCVSSE